MDEKDHRPWSEEWGGPVLTDSTVYRIEALRAASRVMAGILAGGAAADHKEITGTIEVAERFARWLEAGERDE